MSKPWAAFIVVLSFALVGAGCSESSAEAGATHRIVITGSSTLAPMIAEIAKRFERDHDGVRIDVQAGGSTRGITDVRSGLADIGMVSRQLGAEERAALHSHPIAIDGICLITHRDNPVAAPTHDQIIAIYSGRVTNWQSLGAPPRPITVVNKAQGRSTLEVFLKHFALRSDQIQASVIIGGNQQAIKTVAGNPGAIGYVSVGSAQYAAEQGTPIKLLPMGGVPASVRAVAEGDYPLSRTLIVVTAHPSTGWTERLIDYAQSPRVHDLISEHYFVPITD